MGDKHHRYNQVQHMNLETGEFDTFYNVSPLQAVMLAHANQNNHKIYDFTKAEETYADIIYEGDLTIACGDFAAYKSGKPMFTGDPPTVRNDQQLRECKVCGGLTRDPCMGNCPKCMGKLIRKVKHISR